MARGDEQWLDREAGPVVRPYALVRGRTKPSGQALDIIAMAHARNVAPPDPAELEPEHLAVLRQCRVPVSVADLASALDLPLGVVRILLSDLRDRGLVSIYAPRVERLSDPAILREVANGLRRL